MARIAKRSVKSGQTPFVGGRTRRTAATLAARRRSRSKRGRGRLTWLQAWPYLASAPNRGNAGQPPRYIVGHQPARLK